MKKVGFRFEETMSGTYTLASKGAEEREIRFTARMTADDALQHFRDQLVRLEGTLDMDGFADDVPISGTLEMAILNKKRLRYEFRFVGNDGEPYLFAGQKDIRLTDLLATMTTLPATVTDAKGSIVANACVKFDVKADMLSFLASWGFASTRAV